MTMMGGYRSRLEPQSGVCPHCGHDNGPTFGNFRCESCGKLVRADAMAKNISSWPLRKWLWVILGGIAFGVVVSLLGVEFGGGPGTETPGEVDSGLLAD